MPSADRSRQRCDAQYSAEGQSALEELLLPVPRSKKTEMPSNACSVASRTSAASRHDTTDPPPTSSPPSASLLPSATGYEFLTEEQSATARRRFIHHSTRIRYGESRSPLQQSRGQNPTSALLHCVKSKKRLNMRLGMRPLSKPGCCFSVFPDLVELPPTRRIEGLLIPISWTAFGRRT